MTEAESQFEIKDISSLIRYQLKVISDSCKLGQEVFINSVAVLECYMVPFLDINYRKAVEEYDKQLVNEIGLGNIRQKEGYARKYMLKLSLFKLMLLMVKVEQLLPKQAKV